MTDKAVSALWRAGAEGEGQEAGRKRGAALVKLDVPLYGKHKADRNIKMLFYLL